ncbi:MAG: type VI secretion system baseplate subunit TssF [Apibacter sp.]|uniref:type VI secretion system baseplate subunit TssF n=1 Tax=Apibacter sp. TaxID=2023709 RepID=UPI0025E1717A|nr:type VI secretion system baseplate subunit TssF [Apibacter sp.]MCT6869883.1 type VI secretion system baseplate subunit TssF [Apibacter sp.]
MDTKEKIKDRILRRAAQTWGYTDSELETSFDPIVALLLEACASELEKISSELNNSRSRIIERLLEIMSPEINTGIVPARSIIHLEPIENNYTVSVEHQFRSKKVIQNIYDPLQPIVKDIYFGTTLPFILSKAKLEYIAFGNSLYSLKRIIHKDPITKENRFLKNGSLWLGINCPEGIDKIEKLMFFTDVRSSQREIFYNYLKQAKFYINDQEIPYKEGFNVENYTIDIDAVVNKNYNKINQLYSEVNDFYSDKFFHFTKDIIIKDEVFKVPDELINIFGDKVTSMNEAGNIIWLQVQFPEVVINETFENVMFYINAIPVINKRLLTQNQTIGSFINYIPLSSDDIFLDLDSINDSRGYQYHIKEFSEGNLDIGDATLRHTGVTRFDERNASELIQYLIELLKDESASFTVIGGDFIDGTIKEINKSIATLEQHIKEKKFTKSNFPYAIIRPKSTAVKNDNDFFTVSYWVTNGDEANDLKVGTHLDCIGTSDFKQDTIMFINTTVGGKSRMDTKSKIDSYREALLTRGRIVTFADIKTFCQNHFKFTIKGIEIKKGTKIDSSTNKGFVRTIDIILERNLATEYQISDFEWQYLCDNMLYKLDKSSSNIYPYRLIIK